MFDRIYKTLFMFGLVCIGLCTMTPSALAAVHYVKPDGTGDGSSWENAGALQARVDAASEGDEVWVAAGTYTSNLGARLQMKDGVAIYGGFSGVESGREERDWTVNISSISGAGRPGDWMVKGANNATLDGFTITGGDSNQPGGAMYNLGVYSLVVTNCVFLNNKASEGGGIYNNNTSVTVNYCTFSGNSASYGGGMYNEGSSVVDVSNCLFSDNSANNNGGGIYNNDSDVTIDICTFMDNRSDAGRGGGGVYNYDCSPMVTDSVFKYNYS
jgi:predicted outer membrane repeat protein